MRGFLRKLLSARVRSYLAKGNSNGLPLTLHQAITYTHNQPALLIYALMHGRYPATEIRREELHRRSADLVIEAAFKTKKRLHPEIKELGSRLFSTSGRVDQQTPAIFVTSHHGYVALMTVYLQKRGFKVSLVAADPRSQQDFATYVWGASPGLDIFKPNENVLLEIRKRLKEGSNVMLCVDYSRPASRRRGTSETFVSSIGFSCAEKLDARIVFAHARLRPAGEIEFHFEDYGHIRQVPLKAAGDYLRWLNKIDPSTQSWIVTEKVAL